MAGQRTPLIAGNWKMYKTEAQAEEYIQGLLPRVSSVSGVEIAVCVPFTDLRAMVDSARGSRVEVYAQNMHHEPEGAFTGEVSAPMLSELDVTGVVLGHSERRELFGETDRALALKVPAALAAGLTPILCVGETESERDEGDTERKLRHQIGEDLANVPDERLADVVIAYEPIWAIGTGKVATPEQAREAIAFVRALVGGRSAEAAERVRILYGGSVKPGNASRAACAAGRRRGTRRGRLARCRVVCRDRDCRSAMSAEGGSRAARAPCVCLVVLDGWGLAAPGPGNAVSLANTPVFDELWATYPHTTLTACGAAVGLPEGQMGNSEVGHLNLGAGAVVKQDLVRIDEAIADGELARNERAAQGLRGSTHPPAWAGLRRWGALLTRAPARADRARGRARAGGGHSGACVHRWARHAPTCRGGLSVRAGPCPARTCGVGGGSLLGDGSRSSLGSHAAGLRHARPWGGPPSRLERRAGGAGGI